jgi:hypothetical protein
MSEAEQIAKDDEANNLIVRDKEGNPLPDPKAVMMRERESYERVVEGLKIAADAAKHCAKKEPSRAQMWLAMASRLDQVRRVAVDMAGISDTYEKQTGDVIGQGMEWLDARKRFSEGLKQAAGGARQIAVVHRSEIQWLQIAHQVEQLSQSVSRKPILSPDDAGKKLIH